MSLPRATSVDENLEWVRRAVFEIDDLRDCFKFEMKGLARSPAFLDPLSEGLRALDDAVKDGSDAFGREDLPFMDPAASTRKRFHAIPCSNRSTRRTVAASMSAGMMPETGTTNMAERMSQQTPRPEG